MSTHTIAELRANPRELIDRASRGEAIEIVEEGKVVARISGVSKPQTPRRMTPEDVDRLFANRVGRIMPKDDAGTLLRRIRDEEPG